MEQYITILVCLSVPLFLSDRLSVCLFCPVCFCLLLYLSISSVYPSVSPHPLLSLSRFLSLTLFVCLSVSCPVYIFCLSICLLWPLSLSAFVSHSIYLSVFRFCLSVWLSVIPSPGLSMSPTLSVSLYVLSVNLSPFTPPLSLFLSHYICLPSLCLPSLSVCPHVLSVYLSPLTLSPTLCLCLSLWLSVCPSVSYLSVSVFPPAFSL